MTGITLEELNERAGYENETRKTYIKYFRKEGYDLAKSLGFSASQARILRNFKHDTIIRLAQERNG